MPTPTSFPRIPDLPAYPTVLVVGGLVLALYVQLRKDRLNILMAESPPSNVESRPDKVSSTALPPIIVPANDIPSGVLSPTLRAEAPAFRPRADSGSPAGNIWTNIPERARELRKLAELQYQESCECKKRAQVYNAEAAKVIYNNKNKNPQGSWIDLHGLYATEAVSYANLAIDEAQERGVSLVKLIVGRGLHSADASAKVKPRVLEGMQKRGVRAEVDSTNDGVVTVYLKHRVRICSPNGEPVALASMMVASNDRRAA